MTTATDHVISISGAALDEILGLRAQETVTDLHLGLRIAGVGSNGFRYETAFVRPDEVAPNDHVEMHGGLPVAIPQDSIDNLRGAELDISSDPAAPGLVLRNPNPATPALGHDGSIELTGAVEERVRQLLDEHINPAIAAHGGVATLMSVEAETAYLELGGGCQGCGLAAMTLRQGIETAILHNIPEITEVVDVTNHDAGENPFYV
ncbi:MAG TPA: NifU family protein [Acidimicrobiia bacterium]|jgi:Fe/S biogenesis protein NfuA